ncbi:MAG TPA: HAD family phosphatase [Geobacteraceae bacterium]|nr:HAD family phosphatase [Geobacteraceae bacterium]
MLKAVVFDFDGIIVDSEPLHCKAFQKLLEPLGAGFTWDEYVEKYMGFDDRDAFREAFRVHGLRLDDELLSRLIAAKAAMFQEVAAEGVNSYSGAVDLIRQLSGKVPLALCSGALLSDIEPVLGMLSIPDAFDCIVTADDVSASKPDPASYLLAVQKLQQLFPSQQILPAHSVAIEDTPAGISSAKGAGLKVLSVTNSYPGDELRAADRVVDSLSTITLEDLQQLVP